MSDSGNALINASAGETDTGSSVLGGAASPSSGPSGAQALDYPGAQQAGDVLKYMKAQMDQTAAGVKKLQEAKGRFTVLRQTLDSLMKLGDTVTPEDVTKESSKLVAAGMSASQVAEILAEMPEGSEALQGWIAQHDAVVRQNEARVGQMLALQQHQLGIQALHHIGAVSMVNHGMQQAPLAGGGASPSSAPVAPSSNPLTGGA